MRDNKSKPKKVYKPRSASTVMGPTNSNEEGVEKKREEMYRSPWVDGWSKPTIGRVVYPDGKTRTVKVRYNKDKNRPYRPRFIIDNDSFYGGELPGVTITDRGSIPNWRDQVLGKDPTYFDIKNNPQKYNLPEVSEYGLQDGNIVRIDYKKADLPYVRDAAERYTKAHPEVRMRDYINAMLLGGEYNAKTSSGIGGFLFPNNHMIFFNDPDFNGDKNFNPSLRMHERTHRLNDEKSIYNPKERFGYLDPQTKVVYDTAMPLSQKEEDILRKAYGIKSNSLSLKKNEKSDLVNFMRKKDDFENRSSNMELRTKIQEETGKFGEDFNKYIDKMSDYELFKKLYYLNGYMDTEENFRMLEEIKNNGGEDTITTFGRIGALRTALKEIAYNEPSYSIDNDYLRSMI